MYFIFILTQQNNNSIIESDDTVIIRYFCIRDKFTVIINVIRRENQYKLLRRQCRTPVSIHVCYRVFRLCIPLSHS